MQNIKNLEIEFLAVTKLVLIYTPGTRGGRRGVLATVIIIQPCPGRSPPLCSVVQYLHSAQFNIHTGPPVLCTAIFGRQQTGREGAVCTVYGSDNYTVRPQQ